MHNYHSLKPTVGKDKVHRDQNTKVTCSSSRKNTHVRAKTEIQEIIEYIGQVLGLKVFNEQCCTVVSYRVLK